MARVAPRLPRAWLLVVGARNPTTLRERRGPGHPRRPPRSLGYSEDVPEILRANDCCVHASWAGLELIGALREALAVETPVVASDLAGNPELVREGITGLLFPPRDTDALADAIVRLASHRERAGAMGRARAGRRSGFRARQGRADGRTGFTPYRRLLHSTTGA